MSKYKHSLVLGKFMDAHIGHEALIRHTISLATQTTVLVCGTKNDRNATATRVQWLRDTFGVTALIVPIDIDAEGLSGKEESDREVSADWMCWVHKNFPDVDVLCGSEDYVRYMAEHGNIAFEIFDQERVQFPISSTKVNEGKKGFRIHEAKADLVKKVYIIGAESSGKSVATNELSNHFNCLAVFEQARDYLNPRGGFCQSDLNIFALAQELAVRTAIRDNWSDLLIVDSSAITTLAYREHQFGDDRHNIVNDLAMDEKGLFLLFTPETKWVDDGTRYMDDVAERWELFQRMRALCDHYGHKYATVTGTDYKDRINQAIEFITEEYL